MKSMTGYGRARQIIGEYEISVELHAVNHRFFDCTVKVPRTYSFLEDVVKKKAGEHISRGKVDIYITVNHVGGADTKIVWHEAVAKQYFDALTALRDHFAVRDDISVMSIAKMPDVLVAERAEADAEQMTQEVLCVFAQAVAEFDAMRMSEGERLCQDIAKKRQSVLELVTEIERLSPESVKEYREKLEKRMRDILQDSQIDEQRLVTEAALFADKTAVDEETVRLRSHMEQLAEMVQENKPIGRKLDFLVQEMNREANTIGSKVNHAALARLVVDMKAEIEKIREQVQNLE